jgi:hypothetical protein
MTRAPRNAKRAKITTYTPKSKKRKAGSASMVVLAPTLTRRGKIIYNEEDAALYYGPSNDGGEASKRKPSNTPSRSRTTVPASLEDPLQWEGSCLNDQEPDVPRITKVRLRSRYVL